MYEQELDPALGEVSRRVLTRVLSSMSGERREGQERMIAQICEAISSPRTLVIQAGTGTGKSLGYLVPVLTALALGGGRALVSTATLALQRQILTKDAPAVVEALTAELGRSPEIALLKGWSNYLCLHKIYGGYPREEDPQLLEAPSGGVSASSLGAEILRLREWASTTDTGDRDDLIPGTSDRAWRHVSVNKRECLSRHCPAFDECFARAAREKAAAADLVVTNHSLVGIVAMEQSDLFGEIDLIVVDEAHELPARVREQASVHVSAPALLRVARSVRTHAGVVSSGLDEAADALSVALSGQAEGLIEGRGEELETAISLVDAAVRLAHEQVNASGAEVAAKTLARAALDEAGAVCEAWRHDEEQMITWVESLGEQAHSEKGLVIAPLEVGYAIASRILAERPSILTSATLALGGSFTSIARECGLSGEAPSWEGIDVGSPFDPASQAILYCAEHLPPPSLSGICPQACDLLVELVCASGGGALLLFSSWKGARAGAEELRKRTDLEVLLQGEEGSASLIEQFRQRRDCVLVGTLGMWQGVDVPGASCRLVVIDRIPFPHPDNPIVRARTREANRSGRNGFMDVSLTHAALLLAQGAGRLLRSPDDKGVVAILDSRVVTRSYGGFLRASLPKMWPTTHTPTVLEALRRLHESL